jgi:hypothetical protein
MLGRCTQCDFAPVRFSDGGVFAEWQYKCECLCLFCLYVIMFTRAIEEIAIDETFAALRAGVHVLRPASDVREIFACFACISATELGEQYHFFVEKGFHTVTIYCSKPSHSYRTVLYPSPNPFGEFTGRLVYTNLLTGRTVETLYMVKKVWWLHGLPRNIENGSAVAVMV